MSNLYNLVDRRLSVTSVVEFGDIINGLDGPRDAMDLVQAIDLSQEDTGFSCELIKMLFKSLRGDLDQDEAKELIKELKQINKSIL